ncbi:MAG: polysaccharide biosynthesis protein [Firmicutes bacterium]|nr:polysaccharide biosynthesis protein [Bacillota bacterium]
MSLAQGVLVLLISGALTKFIGVFYRVPLSYLLGAEGIGLYQMAYPVFGVAVILASGGLPLAIARFMAEQLALRREDKAWRIYAIGRQLLILQGLILAVLLFGAAPLLATKLLGDPRAELPLRALAPAVFLVAVEGSLKGYFQGRQMLSVLAQGQALEQVCRVATMLLLAHLMLPLGLEYAAAGATAGAAGGAASVVLFLEWQQRCKPRLSQGVGSGDWYVSARQLCSVSLPVMLGSFIMPVMQMVDAAIVPLRLQAGGIPMRTATALFGHHAGMAMSLVGIPTVATAALATALVPSIAGALAQGDQLQATRRVRQALSLTLAVAIPAVAGLYALPEEICLVLFNSLEAAVPLRYLAFGTIGLCLMETGSALLHSMGLGRWAVLAIFCGGLLNAVLDYHLSALPLLNIRGAALGTALGFSLAAVLILIPLIQKIPGSLRASFFFFPTVAASIMFPVVRFVLSWVLDCGWPLAVATLGAVAAGAAVYGVLALLLGMLFPEAWLIRPR